jgi:hypothetical protein
VTAAARRRRLQPVASPHVRKAFRAVDGNRSPFYAALKRRADLVDELDGYRLTLAEHRQIVIPWLRWPLFTYWHRGIYHAHKLETLEVVVRVFLETGHFPAQWHL